MARLPMPVPPLGPPSRDELISALCGIVSGAQIVSGRQSARLVKLDAQLIRRAAALIRRETAARKGEADASLLE